MSDYHTATEATMVSIANKSIAVGAPTAVIGGLTANEIAAYCGAVAALLGVVVQLYFKLRADRRGARAEKRDAELHAAQMAQYKGRARNGD